MRLRSNYSVPTLEDQILVDATEAVQGINQLKTGIASLKAQLDSFSKNNGLSNFSKQTSGIGDTIKKTINFSAVYIGAKQVLGILKDMTNESVNYAETVNLFNVSMGKGLEDLNQYYEEGIAFQEKLEEKLGVNIEESMRYQALFNSMTKSMGLSANYAYTLSENMTKLGYDLASLYNIDTESAMTKLRAGLAGQTEPLRELGLDITEQSLKPIAQELGITESIRNMSQAEKAVLRYIAVLRQAQIAQGDFANTMDSPANQLRIFNAQVTAFKRNMGNLWQGMLGGILPYINAIMMVINELLKMVAKLFGFEISSQTVNISASVGADDLADDLGTASGKAKELKNQLMGFDEINNITLDTENNSSSSGGTSGTGIDQRLLDAMKEYDNLMDKVSNKATEIRDKMLQWLGFKRDDDGTWKLKEGLTNFEKILDIVKTIGIAIGTWKISNTVTNLLKNLGILKGKQNFQLAFGITLLATGIFAQYKGTRHLLNGDIDLFTLLETFLGTTSGALGIVSILKATKLGKSLSLGNKLKVGFGVMLGIQGVQVFLDGISEGDIKKTLLGAFEGVTSLTIAFNGLFGKKLIQSIKNTTGSIATFGTGVVKSFKDARASGLSLGKSFLEAGNSAKDLIGKGAGLVAGFAGITAGSALTYSTMKDFTTGTIDTTEAVIKLTAGLGTATLSGAAAGSQFGTLGIIIGGVAGLTTSAITAFMGYKDGIESLNIPVTTLTDEIKSLTEEVDANRQAHEQAVQSIQNTYESQLIEAEYADKLSQQLKMLVDANGQVKAGNEERAKFILNELNSALGTEYELNGRLITKNGEVINSYEDLQDSITETVEAKKKEAEQTANIELYKESLKEQIQLEKDKAKLQEEYAKAEIEYNELMSKGLSDWTLTHDENCKQIIQNYIDVADKLNATRDEYWEVTDDVSYYSQRMTDDIVENTGKVSKEMITQQQISSETLQNMVLENTQAWEESYNNLNTTTQSAMLAQSTTLDNWSPTIEQKWKDMANNSAENFLNGIAQVEPETQAKILSTVTTTENMTPQMATAWSNLANTSFTDFAAALSQVEPATQDEILKSITVTQGLTGTTAQAWATLAQTSKDRYNNALSSLDDDTAAKIQSAVDEINAKTGNSYNAGYDLGYSANKGTSDGAGDTSQLGKDFAEGYAGGILGSINKAVSAAKRMVKESVAQAQLAQDSHSPSKVTRKLGNDNGMGYALGIQDMIPTSVKSAEEMASKTIGTIKNKIKSFSISKEIGKINPKDFKVDTSQFVDYGMISEKINTQTKIEFNDLPEQVRQAVIEGMNSVSIPIEIEARADEGVVFKKVQVKAREYEMQTGKPAFEF